MKTDRGFRGFKGLTRSPRYPSSTPDPVAVGVSPECVTDESTSGRLLPPCPPVFSPESQGTLVRLLTGRSRDESRNLSPYRTRQNSLPFDLLFPSSPGGYGFVDPDLREDPHFLDVP